MYDIGSGQLVGKTQNRDHGDAVTDVAVNPRYMEWASTSIDGHVRTFRYPAVKNKSKVNQNRGGGTSEKVNAIKVRL